MLLNDPNWIQTAAGVAETNIFGPIPPGSSANVNITLTIDPNSTGGDLTNFAEIESAQDDEGNNPPDSDSTPDGDPNNDGPYEDNDTDNTNGDEDDHDPETVTVEIFDLALEKTLVSSGPFYPGSDVTYLIEVTNQGTVDAYNVEVVDYIPNGMTLNDPNWTLGVSNQAYAYITGPITPGTSALVSVTMTIDPSAADPNGGSYTNYAEISRCG